MSYWFCTTETHDVQRLRLTGERVDAGLGAAALLGDRVLELFLDRFADRQLPGR